MSPNYASWVIMSTKMVYLHFQTRCKSSSTHHTPQTTGVPGLVNFYHRFIPRCADILTPFNALLKTTSTNSPTIPWNSAATSSFQEIKDALAKATLLVHPKPEAPINVMTDASDVAIGAVLGAPLLLLPQVIPN